MDVLLIDMPFAPVDIPLTGLSLLAQCLRDAGYESRVHYPNVAFAKRIGDKPYTRLSRGWLAQTLVGEWLFSRLLHGADPLDGAAIGAFVASLERRHADQLWAAEHPTVVADLAKALPDLVAAASALIDGIMETVGRLRPKLVGLSSCYHQHTACLAAAKRIKEAFPDTVTVLGGSNCSGVMGVETFRRFPFLDAVVAGPGEIALVELVRNVLDGRRDLDMPGVYLRGPGCPDPAGIKEGVAPEPPLGALPFVDYDDFFDALGADDRTACLPIETARGCWWGQKHHCVFCSENGDSIKYRMKPPERVTAEYNWLMDRYPGRTIRASDEILDPRVIATVMPRLAKRPDRSELFFSIKANIRKDELAALAAAGTRVLQAGIESLDDDILREMRKGVTAIRNIQLLKWCRELGLEMRWGILYGFPFERPDSYRDMVALLPLLAHLDPPKLPKVQLQRYSPLFLEAERFGLTDVRPDESYRHIHPFPDEVIGNLAYWFTYECPRPEPLNDYIAPLHRAVRAWEEAAKTACLFYSDEKGLLAIGDTRPAATRPFHALTGVARAAYLACDGAQPLHAICRQVAAEEPDATPETVETALARLLADRLMFEDKGLYLSLATRLSKRNLPPVADMARFLAAKAALRQPQPVG